MSAGKSSVRAFALLLGVIAALSAVDSASATVARQPITNLPSARSFVGTARGASWWSLRPAEKELVARAFLETYGRRFRVRVSAPALVEEVAYQIRTGLLDKEFDGRKPLRRMLMFPASTAQSQALFEAKAKWLPSKRLVGKTVAQVKRLIGPPEHTQEVAGQIYWYYKLRSNAYQLVIHDGRVIAQNKL